MKLLVLSFFLPFWILPAPHAEDFYAGLGPALGVRVESVQQACTYASTHLLYADNKVLYHRTDYWQRPDMALQLGYGSCTAYVLVVLKLLDDSGLGHASMAVVPPADGGPVLHAVVLYHDVLYDPQEKDGQWPTGQPNTVLGVMDFLDIPHYMWVVNDGPDRRKDVL